MRINESAQVTVEYFILFAIVALLTGIVLTNTGNQFRSRVEGFVNDAAVRIAH